MAGVDLRTVAEVMGHKTIQMTMRYAHLAPAHQLDAVERIASQAARGPAPAEPSASTGATTSEGILVGEAAPIN
jgi:hypothetical protein